jgi:hypothetical protein
VISYWNSKLVGLLYVTVEFVGAGDLEQNLKTHYNKLTKCNFKYINLSPYLYKNEIIIKIIGFPTHTMKSVCDIFSLLFVTLY